MNANQYTALDTYPANLCNETPPRREEVTEIQCREMGELLCYANPDRADFITRACNSHAKLLASLHIMLKATIDGDMTSDFIEEAQAAIAEAEGKKPVS